MATPETSRGGPSFVPPHGSVAVTWNVDIPASATPGPAMLTATARYFTIRGAATASGTATVLVS